LYDWNPAEFPRRLRHQVYGLAVSSFNIELYYSEGMVYVNMQIFEWLASMPVELEGYIRPGCTILTVFVAMPQHMWDKVGHLRITTQHDNLQAK